MKPIATTGYAAILSSALLLTHLDAQAQKAVLRVTCEGPDAGAEVFINGKVKGECPLDIMVDPGNVEFKAVKPISEAKEGVFEQTFRIGSDVVKKVTIELSPKLTALGQKREDERLRAEAAKKQQDEEESAWRSAARAQDSASLQGYLNRYPNGVHAAEARDKMAALRAAPPTPAVQVAIGSRGRAGIEVQAITKEKAQALGLPNTNGALLSTVEKGRAAEKAGLQAGDVVLAFNGTPVANNNSFIPMIRNTPAGSTVLLQLWRNGGTTEVKLVLEELPDELFFNDITKSKIQQTKALFPTSNGNKVLTLKLSGTILNEAGQEQYAENALPVSYDIKIYQKNGICNWDLSNGNTWFYFGAGLLSAGAIGPMLDADTVTLRQMPSFSGSLVGLSPQQTLQMSASAGDTKITVEETKASWPEFNFPYAGTRLSITRNYEPMFYYDREQVALYSPDVGCAIPISQKAVRNTGNRLFGHKTTFTEKALSAVMSDR
ncbi:PDZ domain-containing protein [Variovorax sp. HJSM1_2]|uniref:PDZ domain-containing protein n=1 Tax=Variovorax sp. HJSM1_2 TaxID=3366263 RepID=UPI003BD5B6BF